MPLAGGAQAHEEAHRPGGTLDWSMACTIEGLKRAADSIAYSMVKQAPMKRCARVAHGVWSAMCCLTAA